MNYEEDNLTKTQDYLRTGVKLPDYTFIQVVPSPKKTTYIFKDQNQDDSAVYYYEMPLTITPQCNIGKELKRHLNPEGRLSDNAVLKDFEDIKKVLNEFCQLYELSRENKQKETDEEIEQRLQERMEEAKDVLECKNMSLIYIASLVSWLTAGERNNIMLTFICYCSQIILRNPISVIAIGDGGSGKTHIVKTAQKLIPREFVINEKKIKEAAMFNRAKEDPYFYDGKIVDYGDLGNDPSQQEILEAKNMLKEMQTDGFMNKPLSVPDPEGGWVTRDLTLYGFPCLTYTTVPGFKFDDQEMSRSIFITPRTDNRAVFNARKTVLELKEGKTYKQLQKSKKDIEIVQYMVYLLRERMENVEIVNPYTCSVISFLGESEYFKRDFDKYNGILKTITAFNSYNREPFEINGKKIIFTTLDDLQLFISLLISYHDSISGNITPKAAEVLNDLKANMDDWLLKQKTFEVGITTSQYAELTTLNLSKRSIQRYFGELNSNGFLKVVDKQGRTGIYNLTEHTMENMVDNLLTMTEKQKELIKFEIGKPALDFIECDEKHEHLSIMLHDPDVKVPSWELYDH